MEKVAIVGVEGSGKTVMLAGLGELYSKPDAQGYFLAPKNYETANYVADKIERMRRGEWPSATAGDALQGLDWMLRRKAGAGCRPEDVCEVSFLDFAGEVYRVAFGVREKTDLADEAESLKRYIREADDVIVLINLSDVIAHGLAEPRVRESMWITNGILSFALEAKSGRRMPRAAIVLSQADSYRDTIDACGGVRGVLAKYLPHVANNYDWLDLLAANAVDRTIVDDEGRLVPAKDFTSAGLQPIVDWILRGLSPKPRRNPAASASVGESIPPPSRGSSGPVQSQKGLFGYYFGCFAKYAVFRGRARRKEYWSFTLLNFLVMFLLAVVDVDVFVFYALAMLLPGFAVCIRRLHDTNQSGWWFLISLLPYAGWLVFLIFMCCDGTPGYNDYGPNPKR